MKKTIYIILVLFFSSSLSAQFVQSNGPSVGNINCIAIDGSTIFAGVGGGINRSTNNGVSWEGCFGASQNIRAVTIVGSNIFAGTYGVGIYRSTNNGNNWVTVNNGITGSGVWVYSFATIGTNIYAGTDGGVYVTTNNGTNWSSINSGLTNLNVYSIISNANVLFAGTFNGVFRSSNNGVNWLVANNGISSQIITALSMTGTNLFAGTSSNGIFLSTNNGDNWSSVNSGLTNLLVKAITVIGTSIFAGTDGGVFRSTNIGNNWSAVNNNLTELNIQCFGISGTDLIAGTGGLNLGGGLFRSSNNGAYWYSIGLPFAPVKTLAGNGANLFAGTYGAGVHISTNNGSIWSSINNGLTNLYIYKILLKGNDVFAFTWGGGAYRSTNNGSNWYSINNGFTNFHIYDAVVKGANIFTGHFTTSTQGGVFMSTNNGETWNAVNNGLSNLLVQRLAVSGNNIFAGTSTGGVFISTNDGNNWSQINNGLTNLDIQEMITLGANVFVGTMNAGVFRTTNNGITWTAKNNGLGGLSSISSFAKSGNNLFVGLGASIYTSTNFGDNWVLFDSLMQGTSGSEPSTLFFSNNYMFAGSMGVWKRNYSVSLPLAPLQITPLNNSTNNPINLNLVWNKPLYAESFNVIIANDSTFSSIIINDSLLTDSIKVLTNLNTLTKYYWKVRAKGSSGWGLFSSVWNFTTIVPIPLAPILLSPPNNITNLATYNITLDWSIVANATSYRAQIANDSLFVSMVFDTTNVTQDSLRLRNGLLAIGKYYWRINASNNAGTGVWSSIWNFTINPTGTISINNEIPKEYKIYNNYPNPFNPTTMIKFEIPKSSNVKISAFDITGKEIEVLVNEKLNAGTYQTGWNGSSYSSGVYFYRLETENFTETKRMLLIK